MEGSRREYGEGQLTSKAPSRVTWNPTVEAFLQYTHIRKNYKYSHQITLGWAMHQLDIF